MHHVTIANTKIVVLDKELERGYQEGFRRYTSDYPGYFPSDQAIASFLFSQITPREIEQRRAAGVCLGWCAALLANGLYVSLPTAAIPGRKRSKC